MIKNIEKTSIQYLQNVFSPLDQYQDYVIWIRNRDLTQQIFTSKNYESIWERPLDILYDVPFLWFDYLNPEGKPDFLKQLDKRHHQSYLDPQKNFAYYQIILPDSSLRYIRCNCFKCSTPSGQQYIVGIAKNVTSEIWFPGFESQSNQLNSTDLKVQEHIFAILSQEFAITPVTPLSSPQEQLVKVRDFLFGMHNIKLSARELECLYHLCRGCTAKLTARELNISPRTVETYIESIRIKTGCSNKLEILGRFAAFFEQQ